MKHAPLVLACLLVQPSGASGPAPCEARLQLFRQAQFLTITANCRSLLAAPACYRYQLLVHHRSSSGQSQNNQGGAFALAANQDLALSSVQLKPSLPDHCSAQLLIFDSIGHLVAQDSTSF